MQIATASRAARMLRHPPKQTFPAEHMATVGHNRIGNLRQAYRAIDALVSDVPASKAVIAKLLGSWHVDFDAQIGKTQLLDRRGGKQK